VVTKEEQQTANRSSVSFLICTVPRVALDGAARKDGMHRRNTVTFMESNVMV